MQEMGCKKLLALLVVFMHVILQSHGQLSPAFYNTTCAGAAAAVRAVIRDAVGRESRMAASLLRLNFHDCFVQGCDASILLDDAPNIQSEKSAGANFNSVRGYEVIEAAKSEVERICSRVVSCADIVALAARDASVAVGGPSWTVKLGRRDSTTANLDQANSDLPGPGAPLDALIAAFAQKGLNAREMVALSGAHTIGRAQCRFFRDRIYSDGAVIDPRFADLRRQQCPQTDGDFNLAPFDVRTPDSFDNNYYRNLQQRRGLLQSDQVLLSGGETDSIVFEYIRSPGTFATDFANAMVKMSEISPLLGQDGTVRTVCSRID